MVFESVIGQEEIVFDMSFVFHKFNWFRMHSYRINIPNFPILNSYSTNMFSLDF